MYKVLLLTIFTLIVLNIYGNVISQQKEKIYARKMIEQNLIFYGEGYAPFFNKSQMLSSQLKTAYYVSNLSSKQIISGIGWWNAPEISYLTQRKIRRNPFELKDGYFISHLYGKLLGAAQDNALLSIPHLKKVFEAYGYTVYQKQ